MNRSDGMLRVLIADDMSDDIARPYLLTSQLGCDVTLAFDGEQALNDVARMPFDLVILDWNMPIVSGKDFLHSLGLINTHLANQRSGGLNVVLYSGNVIKETDVPDSKYFRIIDYWQKPIGPVEMLRRMKVVREKVRR